jgi:hypothetical protein
MIKRSAAVVILLLIAVTVFYACSDDKPATEEKNIDQERKLENDELVERGRYLITTSGCNDCHTPKVFGPHGMGLDSAKMMSGHRAESVLPAVAKSSLQPGGWSQMGPEVTAFAGPWGVSYAANLTPDSATGIGTWSEEIFIKTLRTGKHLGAENGRAILPPMPWFNLINMKDEDFRSLYAYLRSLPPVNNRVPANVPPPAVKTL